MTIVYIAHPIGGNVEQNLAEIRRIVKSINLHLPNIVPFVPYYADVVSMDDAIPEERARGIKNDLEILTRKGVVDQLWLYGNTISAGMRQECIVAWENRIPIICTSEKLRAELDIIEANYKKQLN